MQIYFRGVASIFIRPSFNFNVCCVARPSFSFFDFIDLLLFEASKVRFFISGSVETFFNFRSPFGKLQTLETRQRKPENAEPVKK